MAKCIEKWKCNDHLFYDEVTKMFYIHDVLHNFDYSMSKFDIERNISISKKLTGKAQYLNAILENGKIVLVDSLNNL